MELNQIFSRDFSGFPDSVQVNPGIHRVTTEPFHITSN
jgi:hypothetical protein